MKKAFLLGVIAYAAVTLLLNDWPMMATTSGHESAAWLAAMVVDLGIGAVAAWRMFGHKLNLGGDEDFEVGDIEVPDLWFYGVVMAYVGAHCAWHAAMSVMLKDAASVRASIWFVAEVFLLALTFVFFRTAKKKADKLARSSRPTAIRSRDAG